MAYILNGQNHVLKNGMEKVTSDYGNRSFSFKGKTYSDFHTGIDLVSSKSGTDYIIAYEDGKVSAMRNTVNGYDESLSSGNYIYIDHGDSYQTRYYHLKKNSLCVKNGEEVKKGQVIAYMGSTGFATGNHLHFEIRKNNQTLNPKNYLLGKENISNDINLNSQSNLYKVGDKVIFTGFLYRDSYGNGKGASKKDFQATISLINPGSKCPYNLNNGLGWVMEEDIFLIKKYNKYYVVKAGDTLWKVAKKFYNNGSKYPEIAKANNINDPNKIYPGQKLIIP